MHALSFTIFWMNCFTIVSCYRLLPNRNLGHSSVLHLSHEDLNDVSYEARILKAINFGLYGSKDVIDKARRCDEIAGNNVEKLVIRVGNDNLIKPPSILKAKNKFKEYPLLGIPIVFSSANSATFESYFKPKVEDFDKLGGIVLTEHSESINSNIILESEKPTTYPNPRDPTFKMGPYAKVINAIVNGIIHSAVLIEENKEEPGMTKETPIIESIAYSGITSLKATVDIFENNIILPAAAAASSSPSSALQSKKDIFINGLSLEEIYPIVEKIVFEEGNEYGIDAESESLPLKGIKIAFLPDISYNTLLYSSTIDTIQPFSSNVHESAPLLSIGKGINVNSEGILPRLVEAEPYVVNALRIASEVN
jgi:hypothetical protein